MIVAVAITMIFGRIVITVSHEVSRSAGLEQFHAFDQDVIDNRAFLAKGPLSMPVLAIGGEKSFGPMMATVAQAAATNVRGAVVPGSGHWLMEEPPQATVSVIADFLR